MHAAVDILGHLLALHVSPADEQDRTQVEELAEAVAVAEAEAVREATGESVELAYLDQGYTGEEPAKAAAEHMAFGWRWSSGRRQSGAWCCCRGGG